MRRMGDRIISAALMVLAAVAAGGAAGCRIDTDKHGDGDNVKIATPFGGMSVKTDDASVLDGLGLPLYPGATAVKKDKLNGKDNGSADVNMSFGSFQLRVKAAGYRSDDPPSTLLAFYKKALGRYGDVIECDNHRAVGSPDHTAEGLTCDDDNHSSNGHGVHMDTSETGSGKHQLKAGSKKHQHIVDIDPDHGGTRFGLVALDLPTDFHFGDKDGGDKNRDDAQ